MTISLIYGEPVAILRRECGDTRKQESVRDRLERESYEDNPLAFWLRPDRDDFAVPCWQIEEPYAPMMSVYDARTMTTYHYRRT